MRHIKTARQIAIEAGYPGDNATVNLAAAYSRLSAVVEVFLQFADSCNDLEQLKSYVQKGFDTVTESYNRND